MENLSSVLICLIILLICIYAVINYGKKLKNGCCGTGGGEVKVRAADKNKAHYPYKTVLFIDGMTCRHCAARIENAFNAVDGCFAKVNLRKKCADLRTKTLPDRNEIKNTVKKAGYKFVSIVTEK